MLDVFYTVDVEIWCDGWVDIDAKFANAYRQYIIGPTSSGNFGLPYQLEVLKDHGILGTFFVEPLFATRFGNGPLEDIVGMIESGGQEVQMHMHTEWVDEAREPLIENMTGKRQHLFHFSLDEQVRLIETGAALLAKAGCTGINAFRAGNFGFNIDTLRALAANGIAFDSSYNATMFGPASGVQPGVLLVEPIECEGVYEYPMTVFRDGTRSLRHVQLTACSYRELERLLFQSLEDERNALVILSHGFELLSPSRTRSDDVVVGRFRKLCKLLGENRDSFRTCGFRGLSPRAAPVQPVPLTMDLWRTGERLLEQAYRRKYR